MFKRLSPDVYAALDKFINENPNSNVNEFRKAYPDLKFSDSVFSRYKKKKLSTQNSDKDPNKKRAYKKHNLTNKSDQILQAMKISANGLSLKDLMALLCTTKQGVYSAIYTLNRRYPKAIVISENGRYVFRKGGAEQFMPSVTALTTTADLAAVTNSTFALEKHGITKKVLADLVQLSSKDQNDYLENLKQSIFYNISAQGIIQANKIVDAIRAILAQ